MLIKVFSALDEAYLTQLEVEPETSFQKLKQLVQDKQTGKQVVGIYVNGRACSDDAQISEYGVVEGSEIFVNISNKTNIDPDGRNIGQNYATKLCPEEMTLSGLESIVKDQKGVIWEVGQRYGYNDVVKEQTRKRHESKRMGGFLSMRQFLQGERGINSEQEGSSSVLLRELGRLPFAREGGLQMLLQDLVDFHHSMDSFSDLSHDSEDDEFAEYQPQSSLTSGFPPQPSYNNPFQSFRQHIFQRSPNSTITPPPTSERLSQQTSQGIQSSSTTGSQPQTAPKQSIRMQFSHRNPPQFEHSPQTIHYFPPRVSAPVPPQASPSLHPFHLMPPLPPIPPLPQLSSQPQIRFQATSTGINQPAIRHHIFATPSLTIQQGSLLQAPRQQNTQQGDGNQNQPNQTNTTSRQQPNDN
ncbi:MAG: hypothetical protein EZS28_004621 [Streblomastix strix]|uniref:Ubiquitin-like domain-containing protein n=1 Tax=Streblomastix strix TaxID=222440 RepID=A0A5J4WXP9_9EUKA|nr:MAG: hypothetical protein EZS28_004621 [Streblomastix strix]